MSTPERLFRSGESLLPWVPYELLFSDKPPVPPDCSPTEFLAAFFCDVKLRHFSMDFFLGEESRLLRMWGDFERERLLSSNSASNMSSADSWDGLEERA